MRPMARFHARYVCVCLAPLALLGCAEAEHKPEDAEDGAVSAPDRDASSMPADGGGGCVIEDDREHPHDSEPAQHIASPLEPEAYNSDPPSSGPHCSQWGQYATYGADAPLPACNFLHNLEHGAVALLYDCPEGCPDLVEALASLRGDPPADPDCPAPRILLTPYPDLGPRLAAAAWGYTWTADCLDETARASLRDFIEAHWGSRGDAPEPRVCSEGSLEP